jgi:hypothetical protein
VFFGLFVQGCGFSHVCQLLDIAASDMAIMSSEASQLMKMNFIKSSSSTDRVRAISRLLFRLVDPDQAIHLLDSNLSLSEKREVQDSLGQGFRLLIGQPTGHYKLNLGDAQHRDILQRLMIVNKEDRAWLSVRYPDLDTSQHGNGQRFRNEKLDRVKIELHPRMFQTVCCLVVACMESVGFMLWEFSCSYLPLDCWSLITLWQSGHPVD